MVNESNNYVMGETGPFEVVIGLEVHAQVISNAKLFSGAATEFGAEPNSQVSFVDAGFPGMLPVINKKCVEQGIKTGLGLNATVNLVSIFDRKNYFYADLPSGYQISQLYHPIVENGFVDIDLPDGSSKRIRVARMHLEQDAGKSFHDHHPTQSLIDLNRSGIALMEIVTEPDIRSADEAMSYVKKLRTILRYLGTCDGNMDQGSMRVDVNVSVRRPGEPFGTRAEIKNVNSFKFIGQAIQYEVHRQIELVEAGEEVVQETRLFDSTRGETRSMRSKENAHDYRYFPDPDLPPLILTQEEIEAVRQHMPELPDGKKHRFIHDFALTNYDADILVSEKEVADYYEQALADLGNGGEKPKLLANWVIGELFYTLNKENLSISESKVSEKDLALLVSRIADGTISGKIGKEVFSFMWESGKSADEIIEEKGMKQVSDTGEIEKMIHSILDQNPDKVAEYKSGKDKLFGFFIGQIMKAMAGKGNPTVVNDILTKLLNE